MKGLMRPTKCVACVEPRREDDRWWNGWDCDRVVKLVTGVGLTGGDKYYENYMVDMSFALRLSPRRMKALPPLYPDSCKITSCQRALPMAQPIDIETYASYVTCDAGQTAFTPTPKY